VWPDRRLVDLFGVTHPIIQAPMAGSVDATMAVAVCEAGGLGSLPCATLNGDQMRAGIGIIQQQTTQPFNANFFCHDPAKPDAAQDAQWRARLDPYYKEFGLGDDTPVPTVDLPPFGEDACAIIEDLKPAVVSFHFGLPEQSLLDRVRAVGCKIVCSANTVREARWLEERGCHAIIAQGSEAGGHRGMFLSEDITEQAGTMALVPQVVDAVQVPVIAAGGIADGRGIAAAFALGASGVQIGTACLSTPESLVSDLHRDALSGAEDDQTVITNAWTGRPARGFRTQLVNDVGAITDAPPDFPTASGALRPLKNKAESEGSAAFSSLLAGQAAGLNRVAGAGALVSMLVSEAAEQFERLSRS
jgi:nitronate monooxygenase